MPDESPIWTPLGAPDAVDICREFGVSTSNSDNSGAINNAVAALGPLGLRAVITIPGNYHFANPLVIGNGSAASLSSWTGKLEGVGSPGWLNQFNGPRVQLTWTGAAGGVGVVIQGPVAGHALRRLFLHGNGLGAIPLQLIGAQFGDFEELYTWGWYTPPVLQSSPQFGGYTTNTMHNRWRKVGFAFTGYPGGSPSVRNGLLLSSQGRVDGNVCFEDFDEIWIAVPATSVGNQLSALHLGGCDSNRFRGLHCLYANGGTDPQYSVTFDYTDGNAGWPEGNEIDSGNLIKAPRNVGAPAAPAATAPNRIVLISGANSAVTDDPGLPNLSWENPRAPAERQQGQPGIIAPSDQGWVAVSQVAANQTYVSRFVPDRDMSVIEVTINVTTAATVNDSIDVGIYDSGGNKVASTGATAGIVNVAGVRTIPLACQLTRGKVYYAALSYGAVGGVAATIQMANFNATNNSTLFGANIPQVRAAQQAVNPLPAAIAPAANGVGCMMAIRTA